MQGPSRNVFAPQPLQGQEGMRQHLQRDMKRQTDLMCSAISPPWSRVAARRRPPSPIPRSKPLISCLPTRSVTRTSVAITCSGSTKIKSNGGCVHQLELPRPCRVSKAISPHAPISALSAGFNGHARDKVKERVGRSDACSEGNGLSGDGARDFEHGGVIAGLLCGHHNL